MAWNQQSYSYTRFNASQQSMSNIQMPGNPNTMPMGRPMDSYNAMSMQATNFAQLSQQQLQIQQMQQQQQLMQQQQFQQQQQQQPQNIGNTNNMMNQQIGGMFQPGVNSQQSQWSMTWPLIEGTGNVPSNQSVSITPGMNTQAVGSIQQQQSQDDSMQLASDEETASTAGITTVINYNHQNKSRDDNSQSEQSNPHMNRPQGAGWPLDKATRKASRAASRDKLLKLTGYQTKAILSDIKDKVATKKRNASKPSSTSQELSNHCKCPICHKMISMDKWIAHATGHASGGNTDSTTAAIEEDDDIRIIDKKKPEKELKRTESDSVALDYLFLQDILKSAYDDLGVLNQFSCQFCKVSGLFFEEILKHIQEPNHMHEIYRWMVLPSSTGHEKYKEHVPDVPIKSRHLKFHFCEVCLKLAGWHANDVEKHTNGKQHANKVQKMRENLEWVQRAHKMRKERAAEDSQSQRNNQREAGDSSTAKSAQNKRSNRRSQAKRKQEQTNVSLIGQQPSLPNSTLPNLSNMNQQYQPERNDNSMRMQHPNQSANSQFNHKVPISANVTLLSPPLSSHVQGFGVNSQPNFQHQMNQLQGAGGMMSTNMGGGNMNVSSSSMSGPNMGPSNSIPNMGQNIGQKIGGNIGMSGGFMQGQHAAHSINTFNTGSGIGTMGGPNMTQNQLNQFGNQRNLHSTFGQEHGNMQGAMVNNSTPTSSLPPSNTRWATSSATSRAATDKTAPAVSNPNKLKEIVSSIRSTSSNDISQSNSHSQAGRSTAAVLATLKSYNVGSDGTRRSPGFTKTRRSPEFGARRSRSPGYPRTRSPDYFRSRSPRGYGASVRERFEGYNRSLSPEYDRGRYPRPNSPGYRFRSRSRSPGYLRPRSSSPGRGYPRDRLPSPSREYMRNRLPSPSRGLPRDRSPGYGRRLSQKRSYSPLRRSPPRRYSSVRRDYHSPTRSTRPLHRTAELDRSGKSPQRRQVEKQGLPPPRDRSSNRELSSGRHSQKSGPWTETGQREKTEPDPKKGTSPKRNSLIQEKFTKNSSQQPATQQPNEKMDMQSDAKPTVSGRDVDKEQLNMHDNTPSAAKSNLYISHEPEPVRGTEQLEPPTQQQHQMSAKPVTYVAAPGKQTAPENHAAPEKAQTTEAPKRKLRRLIPKVLDMEAREALTKKIEATWQKYYHKYYSCVTTNPEIVLEMQKEYLRSYKGFFQDDPYFEYYYVKVAKPEDLREALTLRIDRGSPGPDPTDPDTYQHPREPVLEKVHGSSSSTSKRSRSPRRSHRKSRSPRRRSPRKRSRSPRRRSRSPRRRTRSPRRRTPTKRTRSPRSRHDTRKSPAKSHEHKTTTADALLPTPVNKLGETEQQSYIQDNVAEIASRLMDAAKRLELDGSIAKNSQKYEPIAGTSLPPPQKSPIKGGLPPPQKDGKPVSRRSNLPPPEKARLPPPNTQGLPPPKHSPISAPKEPVQIQNDANEVDDFEDMDDIIILSEAESDGSPEHRPTSGTAHSESKTADTASQHVSSTDYAKQRLSQVSTQTSTFNTKLASEKTPAPYTRAPDTSKQPSYERVSTTRPADLPANSGDLFPSKEEKPKEDRFREQTVVKREDRFKEQSEIVVEDRFQVKEQPDLPANNFQTSHLEPIITSTTQMSNLPMRKQETKQTGSILERLGPQRKASSSKTSRVSRDQSHKSSSSSRSSGESKYRDSYKRSTGSRSSTRQSSHSAKSQSRDTSSNEMFADPFLAFVHKTLTGIILIGNYQKTMATTKEPVELKRKIESEQADMHRRMVTSDGHLLIELARCCADEPDAIERKFPEVNKDIGPILRNLDKQVTTLIADTPIITDDAPLPM